MDSSNREELIVAMYKWLTAAEAEASRLTADMASVLAAVKSMEQDATAERVTLATPYRTNPAVQPETRRPGFRKLVESTMRRRANSEVSIATVTADMEERYGHHVSFRHPYKTCLRGRVAVELGAMRRSLRYPVRAGRKTGTYVYDLSMATTTKRRGGLESAESRPSNADTAAMVLDLAKAGQDDRIRLAGSFRS